MSTTANTYDGLTVQIDDAIERAKVASNLGYETDLLSLKLSVLIQANAVSPVEPTEPVTS